MMLDACSWLGRWPYADVEPDTAVELVARQASRGIHRSLVASLDAVHYVDPRPGNQRLLRELRSHPTLEPVPLVNPLLAHWPDALDHYVRRCDCRSIRLVPGYHGYRLDHPALAALLEACAERGVRAAIQLRLLETVAHPLAGDAGVDLAPLADLAAGRPPLLLLGAVIDELPAIAEVPGALVDLSLLECLDTLRSVLDILPAERVVLGTGTPLLVTSAALAKLRAGWLPSGDREAIAGHNLAAWLGPGD